MLAGVNDDMTELIGMGGECLMDSREFHEVRTRRCDGEDRLHRALVARKESRMRCMRRSHVCCSTNCRARFARSSASCGCACTHRKAEASPPASPALQRTAVSCESTSRIVGRSELMMTRLAAMYSNILSGDMCRR